MKNGLSSKGCTYAKNGCRRRPGCVPAQVDSSSYQAFASPSYPELAIMGVDIDWKPDKLL